MVLHATFVLALSVLSAPLCSAARANPEKYAPTTVKCPKNLAVRPASNGLSREEAAWRESRFPQVLSSLNTYLQTANISGLNVTDYFAKVDASNLPIAGLAISGGGSQSGMGGLGLWQAFDGRYVPSIKAGTGGLAQCLTYLTGLSGGGFNMVIPVATNNFTTLGEIRKNVDLTSNYVNGPTGNSTQFFDTLFANTFAKYDAGFPVSITDIFGQFFRQYLPRKWGYKDFSDIAQRGTAFSQGLAPMPIVLFAEVVSGESPQIGKIMYPAVDGSSTVYEQNPFEFGSWVGGRVQAFLDTKYLGTNMTDGKPTNASACANGFDKVTFAQGTTGNAFNFYFISDFYNIPLFYKRDIPIPRPWRKDGQVQLVEAVAQEFNQTFNESLWATYPNPFEGYNSEMMGVDKLLLVDGSEVGETIPLRPLMIPDRKVDFIISFDSSGDFPGNNWVNGTNFIESSLHAQQLGLPFPSVPDAATLVNLGINEFPTFFGCNDSVETPLVLYMPNAPWSAYTNYSFATPEFTNKQLDLVFENSLNIATWGQGKVKQGKGVPPFPSCIACGMIYKSLGRTGQPIPAGCQACFARHCYNGTVDNDPPYPAYDPSLVLDPGLSFAKWNKTIWNSE